MGTVRMSDLLEQARSFDPSKVESRTTTWAPLEEGFASDAQRRAAFASGYKEKGKKKKDEEVEVVNELTAAEKKLINMMYDKKGNLTPLGKKVMDHGKKKEQVEVQESGHTDVASAMTNVKVAMSALTKMSGELAKLSPDDALPSWWTNKVAIAVDKLDGMADYLDTKVEQNEEMKIDFGTPESTKAYKKATPGQHEAREIDTKAMSSYMKYAKAKKVDDDSIRMAFDNPNHPESKRMMKNKSFATAFKMYKAAIK